MGTVMTEKVEGPFWSTPLSDSDPDGYIFNNRVPCVVYDHPVRGRTCNYCLAREGIHPYHLEKSEMPVAEGPDIECSMCGLPPGPFPE